MNALWINVASLVATVGFGAMAVVLHRRGRRTKEPTFALRTTNLTPHLISLPWPLELTYGGEKIPNLSITKLAFWNGGADTLDTSNMAPADPLTVHIASWWSILEARVAFATNPG